MGVTYVMGLNLTIDQENVKDDNAKKIDLTLSFSYTSD